MDEKGPYSTGYNSWLDCDGVQAFEASRQTVEELLSGNSEWSEVHSIMAAELYARRTEDLSELDPSTQADIILQGAKEVLPEEELIHILEKSKRDQKQIGIKYGIDPTGSDIHLGHAVPILLLNKFSRMGHDVTFVVGDFTAKIGDPTGKSSSRPMLTDEQIEENMATYEEQARKLIDMDNVRLVFNKEWLGDLSLEEMFRYIGRLSVSALLQRSDFRNRIGEGGAGLSLAELQYPVLMGIDSIQLGTKIEVGGIDQMINMQICREMMKDRGIDPEVIVVTDLIEGTGSGEGKMSKSSGNYIALSESPGEIYGKIMSLPDKRMKRFFLLLTEIEMTEWSEIERMMENGVNPMLIKKLLAEDITALLHGREEAQLASAEFEKRFSRKNEISLDVNVELFTLPDDPKDIFRRVADAKGISSSQLRRMIEGGAVRISFDPANNIFEKVQTPEELRDSLFSPGEGILLKVGRDYFRPTHSRKT